jgi:4-alpha-glucanotransferase
VVRVVRIDALAALDQAKERRPAARSRATVLDPGDPSWSLVERALFSRARLAILPAQDLLGLGSEARLNTPGRVGGNWSWRLRRGQLTSALAARLRAATEAAGHDQRSRM